MKRQALTDTDPEAQRVHLELMRSAPPWRKVEIMEDLNRALRLLILAELRRLLPEAPEDEIVRRLADRLLGEELAARAYGSRPRSRE
jgi:hypothetical protein